MPLDAPVAVKEAVLPFKRFRTEDGQTVDSVLGPEMRSTGEVMGIDRDFPTAFAKSQEAAYGGMPLTRHGVHLGRRQRQARRHPARPPAAGARLPTSSRPRAPPRSWRRNGIAVDVVNKFSATQESGETNIVDLINAGEIDIVVNTPSGGMARADGYEIRAAAVAGDKALFTTMAVLGAAVSALPVLREGFRGQEPAGVRRRSRAARA